MAVREFQLQQRTDSVSFGLEQRLRVDEITTKLMSYPEQIERQQEAVKKLGRRSRGRGELQLAESLLMARSRSPLTLGLARLSSATRPPERLSLQNGKQTTSSTRGRCGGFGKPNPHWELLSLNWTSCSMNSRRCEL